MLPAAHAVEDTLRTRDGLLLHRTRLSTPGNDPAWARLLVLHGYGDHSGRYLHFMRWLAERGVESEAIDFRGHGRSGGRRGFVRRWEDYLEDLRAIVSADAGPARPPRFVLGHSHGGLVVAAAMIRNAIPAPRGCILVSPWMRGMTVVNAFWRGVAILFDWTLPWMKIRSGLKDDMMSRDPAMIADSHADPLLLHCATPRWYRAATAAQARTVERANEFKAPLLCLIAENDGVADPIAAEAFANAAGTADKTVHIVKEGRHELLRDLDREESFKLILNWMRERSN